MSKRTARRFIRRLEAEFEGGGLRGRGLTSDISRKGFFIRTQKAIVPGTPVTITIHLDNGRISVVKGIVRRSIKFPMYASEIKNGMGVEIIERDSLFEELVRELEGEKVGDLEIEGSQEKDFIIVVCPSCGVKNKVSKEKTSLGPRCGRCRTPLLIH